MSMYNTMTPSFRDQRVLRADAPVLRFKNDGTFRISVFSDLHYAENTNSDKKTTQVLQTILSQESSHPQLAILNGDLISGEAVSSRSKPSTYIDQIVSPLVKHGIPWATTHGNHDSEMHLDPAQILDHEKRYQLSLTRKMVSEPSAGYTNYYIPVYPSPESIRSSGTGETNDSAPAVILWFFDTRGGHYPIRKTNRQDAVPRPNWVHESVIDWFTSTNARLTAQYNRVIPSLAFFHIPTYAVLAYQIHGVDPGISPGINDERVCQQGYGGGFEYEGQDEPFMQALLQTEGLVATFSGHDHGNDWCFKWTDDQLPGLNLTGNGLNMCYDRRSGYGGYGSWARGGRQILLDQARVGEEVRTWVRLEDGTVSGNMSLSASFGVQPYAADEGVSTSTSTSISPGILPSVVSFCVILVFLFGGIW